MAHFQIRFRHGVVTRCCALFMCAYFVLVLFVQQASASSSAYTVVLNQVRGDECCDKGSLEALSEYIRAAETYHLSSTFVLRYDALRDERYLTAFQNAKEPIELGVLLEITPQLARDASVSYKGPEERWYKAENSFLLGYTNDERKKLIDTIFTTYKDRFRSYPTTTAGWMVDAWSLQYLDTSYGVKVHEITREQWGTDSYTLYGGPVLLPYRPSKNWPLIPASNLDASLQTMIIRQTIPDAIRTYGDLTSAYTSQPNDYGQRGASTSYFKDLYADALHAQPFGFAVVGLENSMEKRHRDEFIRQLRIISDERDAGNTTVVRTSELADLLQDSNVLRQISVFSAKQERDGQWAAWIGTPQYRARISITNGEVALTDLRIYANDFTDPYLEKPTGTPNGYWIAPFVFDGSRYFSPKKVERLFSSDQEKKEVGGDLRNERFSFPDALVFPEIQKYTIPNISSENAGQQIALTYSTPKKQEIRIIFTERDIRVDSQNPYTLNRRITHTDLKSLLDSGDVVFREDKTADKNNYITVLSFGLKEGLSFTDFTYAHYSLFHPESTGSFSLEHSQVIFKGSRAILGRNPMRIVLYASDTQGKPTRPSTVWMNVFPGVGTSVSVQHPETVRGEYYIDIQSLTTGEFTPVLLVDGAEKTLQKIRFVQNCKKEILFCLRHPSELLQYIAARIEDIRYKR